MKHYCEVVCPSREEAVIEAAKCFRSVFEATQNNEPDEMVHGVEI